MSNYSTDNVSVRLRIGQDGTYIRTLALPSCLTPFALGDRGDDILRESISDSFDSIYRFCGIGSECQKDITRIGLLKHFLNRPNDNELSENLETSLLGATSVENKPLCTPKKATSAALLAMDLHDLYIFPGPRKDIQEFCQGPLLDENIPAHLVSIGADLASVAIVYQLQTNTPLCRLTSAAIDFELSVALCQASKRSFF